MPARSYRQHCALARALDVVGHRWSLLIVRNLLLGPQRWSALRATLPGVATNLLSARLAELIDAGVVWRRDGEYGLTERGAALQPALFALADWGEQHCMGPAGDDAVQLRYAMTSMRRRLRPSPESGRVQLVVDDQPYWVRFGAHPAVEQGERSADARVVAGFEGFAALVFAGLSVDEAVARALIEVEGAPVVDAWLRAWRG